MILVSLKDGKKITLDSARAVSALPQPDTPASAKDYDSDENITSDEDKPKQKRQRLTNLTYEEKLQRRKLKNRIAAQSARDRKKSKFESLEENVRLLKEQNEQLRIENSLLKEKTQLLVQENRKLLEFKKSFLSEEGVACSKRKLDDHEYGACEVKSAVFNTFVSQPQKQFHSHIIPKLISVLMLHTLSLIRETTETTLHESCKPITCPNYRPYGQKLVRLRMCLHKLVQLQRKAVKQRKPSLVNSTNVLQKLLIKAMLLKASKHRRG